MVGRNGTGECAVKGAGQVSGGGRVAGGSQVSFSRVFIYVLGLQDKNIEDHLK